MPKDLFEELDSPKQDLTTAVALRKANLADPDEHDLGLRFIPKKAFDPSSRVEPRADCGSGADQGGIDQVEQFADEFVARFSMLRAAGRVSCSVQLPDPVGGLAPVREV